MASEASALRAQYERLGFRVIEGGKSGKLITLTTFGLAEIVRARHDNIMREVRHDLTTSPLNLRSEIDEHIRPVKLPRRGTHGEPTDCFELTKTGFLTVASKYDFTLRFLLALGFDALERDDGYAGALVIQQINARIRELRSQKSGHQEFNFDAESDECEHEIARQHESQERLEQLGHEPKLDLQPQRPTKEDQALDRLIAEADANNRHIDAMCGARTAGFMRLNDFDDEFSPCDLKWLDKQENVAFNVRVSYGDGRWSPAQLAMSRDGDSSALVLPREGTVVYQNGEKLLVLADKGVPFEAILRAYDQLPRGTHSEIGRASLGLLFNPDSRDC